ncbi:ubiquitin-conjugating enzyme E2-binding protein 1 [Tribonema minus]|uniref:RBR-type E3 ubiquitin transferase n=1 Tax=Tribonema minus TaxID=303371 RepID=A0A835Z7M6_9STRA|nr:ubiquitin-conjugating enzyme E2-binding protein 1 [Tribonema minus]
MVLSESDVRALMDAVVDDTAAVVSVPRGAAAALLRFFRWNQESLYDRFYADPDSVTAKVGIGGAGKGMSRIGGAAAAAAAAPPPRGAEEGAGGVAAAAAAGALLRCRICCDDVEDALALPCAHFFCEECWGGFLRNALASGPPCVYTTCPEHKCPQIVTEDVFRAHLSAQELARYRDFALRSFVDTNRRLRFCPGPGCARVARAPRSCTRVKCPCGECFCFKCGDEAHEPVACAELRRWREKCSNESETANWLLANTKMCPKCDTRIEKNQGCNHMTCRQCKYEFCWICMGIWAEHGTNTGGYYKCNKFVDKSMEGMSDAARAKAELERYLHFYKRFQGHALGQAFAETQMESRTEARMLELLENQESGSSGWIDVQFLRTAVEQLIECRRALKYTYVYGYYLTDPAQKRQRDLFENHQENLEKFTERLSELSEKPLETIDRAEVINYTRVTDKFLRSLTQCVRDGLCRVDGSDAGAGGDP